MICEPARAKINLALHVVGRRKDGFHLIDTLVAFADIGDVVTVAPAPTVSLSIDGPFAGALTGNDENLVIRAARALMDRQSKTTVLGGARLQLTKNLPVASGIGGGSADAAAALRALNLVWGLRLSPEELAEIGAPLGADIPMCVAGTPARATGIGTVLSSVPALPELNIVLANPGVAVPTPSIFKALTKRDNPALGNAPEQLRDSASLIGYLASCRNDLEAPAIEQAPAIATVLSHLRSLVHCRLARMSGSGATCFGVFDTAEAADGGADTLRKAHPDWWIVATALTQQFS